MQKSVLVLAVLGLAAFPVMCSGQDALAQTRLEVDRAELTRLLDELGGVVESTAYSGVLRDEAEAQAELIRERLRTGDFRVGDRIELNIESNPPAPAVTLTVEAGPLIDVPTLGTIHLGGILRSELEAHLTTEVGRFIQSPTIRARALIRVAMVGVGSPGYHTLASDLPLSEAVMVAGGPGSGDFGRIRIERGLEVLWSVEELIGPLAEGRTLDELGLQAGDRIVLEQTSTGAGSQSGVQQQLTRNAMYLVIPALVRLIIR